eukprot:PhF_6_TR40734/c0_g1_i1/m.61287
MSSRIHPEIAWAQRRCYIFLTVKIAGAKDVVTTFPDPTRFGLKCSSREGRSYGFELQLFSAIEPENCKYAVLDLVIEVKLKKGQEGMWDALLAPNLPKNNKILMDWSRFVEDDGAAKVPDIDLRSFGEPFAAAAAALSELSDETAHVPYAPKPVSDIDIVVKINEASETIPPNAKPTYKELCRYFRFLRTAYQKQRPIVVPASAFFETKGLYAALRDNTGRVHSICDAFFEDNTCQNLVDCPLLHIDGRQMAGYFRAYLCSQKGGIAQFTNPDHPLLCPYSHSVKDINFHPLMAYSIQRLISIFPNSIVVNRETYPTTDIAPTVGAFKALTQHVTFCEEKPCQWLLECDKVHMRVTAYDEKMDGYFRQQRPLTEQPPKPSQIPQSPPSPDQRQQPQQHPQKPQPPPKRVHQQLDQWVENQYDVMDVSEWNEDTLADLIDQIPKRGEKGALLDTLTQTSLFNNVPIRPPTVIPQPTTASDSPSVCSKFPIFSLGPCVTPTKPEVPSPHEFMKLVNIGMDARHALYTAFSSKKLTNPVPSAKKIDFEPESCMDPPVQSLFVVDTKLPSSGVPISGRLPLPPHVKIQPYSGTMYKKWVEIMSQKGFAGFEPIGQSVGSRVFVCPSALVATTDTVRVYLGIQEDSGQVVAVKSYNDFVCENSSLEAVPSNKKDKTCEDFLRRAHVSAHRSVTRDGIHRCLQVSKMSVEGNSFQKLYVSMDLVEFTLLDLLKSWVGRGVMCTGGHIEAVKFIANQLLYSFAETHRKCLKGVEVPFRFLDLKSIGFTEWMTVRFLDCHVAPPVELSLVEKTSVSPQEELFTFGHLILALLWGKMFDPVKNSIRPELSNTFPHHAACIRDFVGTLTFCDTHEIPPSATDMLTHPFLWSLDTTISFLGSVGGIIPTLFEEGSAFCDQHRILLALEEIVIAETKGHRWGSVLPSTFISKYSVPRTQAFDDTQALTLYAFLYKFQKGSSPSGKYIQGADAVTLLNGFPRLTTRLWKFLKFSPVASSLRYHPAFSHFLFTPVALADLVPALAKPRVAKINSQPQQQLQQSTKDKESVASVPVVATTVPPSAPPAGSTQSDSGPTPAGKKKKPKKKN